MPSNRFFCAGAYPALQRTMYFAHFVPGAVNRSERVTLSVAGKAVNAARAVQRLGGEAILGGFSGGSSGQEMLRLLGVEGLDCGGFWDTDAPVRICQTILPSDGHAFTELVEEGPRVAASDWDALSRHCMGRMQTGVAAVILAGTMPAHAPVDFYPGLIRAAAGPVILDTSGAALLAALEARPRVVKVNADELCATYAVSTDASQDVILELARRVLAGGADCVGITRGPRTAYLVTPQHAWACEIPAVQTISALGSGDCVNAGMAIALARGQSCEDAFAYGLACGTANAETAHPGEINQDRVAALIPHVRMRQL